MEIDVRHNYFSVAEVEACANATPICVLHVGCYMGLYLMYFKVQYVENAIMIRIYNSIHRCSSPTPGYHRIMMNAV